MKNRCAPLAFNMRALLCVCANIAMAFVVYMLCRVAFVCENWTALQGEWHELNLCQVLSGSLRFDTAALCYTLSLYALLALLPLGKNIRFKRWWKGLCRWTYILGLAFGVVANLADCVYWQFTGRRTTSTVFSEFSSDSNITAILGLECLHHWYLVLLGLGLIVGAFLLFFYPKADKEKSDAPAPSPRKTLQYYAHAASLFLLLFPLVIGGIRGGFSTAVRPINISNANQYVAHPTQAAVVLNTPFSFIRTLGKTTFRDPAYLSNEAMDLLYSPVHPASPAVADSTSSVRPNVVVIIVESMAMEYIGAYNGGKGYTPFLDSLIGESLTFDYSFANGRKSIDAMPSILSGIPMLEEPFITTPYALNEVGGLAASLGELGYTTAFFHGAENGSMGFEAFARTTKYHRYYGRTEYKQDKEGHGDADFDGTWAIWDEPYLQHFARSLGALPAPFFGTVFTASSHHPFVVPTEYEYLRCNGHPMYTCIRYTDLALRHFFARASREPWFQNTIFVITADHTNVSELPHYNTDLGRYCVPIIFYAPNHSLPHGRRHTIAQQTDIMPTILALTGSKSPFLAYGRNLLDSLDSPWALNFNNGIYQFLAPPYLLQYDGSQILGLFNYSTDWDLASPIDNPSLADSLLPLLQARIQSYMQRMVGDSLTIKAPPSGTK